MTVTLYTGALWLLWFNSAVSAADECQPSTWPSKRDVSQVGDVVCRYDTTTSQAVKYFTCAEINDKYGLSMDTLVSLNPGLQQDCMNVEAATKYCVKGFHEPLRAWDGKCGPAHGNATCSGTEKQCCNGKTFTCGDTEEDCAVGVCYEGACLSAVSDSYSLDGTCGPKNNNTRCGGKWGDCCNNDGLCGTGPGFCGSGNCWSGNCTHAMSFVSLSDMGRSHEMPWQTGSTPDGNCGAYNGHHTCDVVFGSCCSAEGVCGSETDRHCGEGCQSAYGKCSNGTALVFTQDYGHF